MADWYLPCLSSFSGDSFWASCAEAQESSQKTKIRQTAKPEDDRSAKAGFDLICDISPKVSERGLQVIFQSPQSLVITHNFGAKRIFTFSACGAGGRIEPGVERSGTPGIWCEQASSPRSGRQLFVIRSFIIIEIGSIAVARFAGLRDKSLSYLGFRCAPPQALL